MTPVAGSYSDGDLRGIIELVAERLTYPSVAALRVLVRAL